MAGPGDYEGFFFWLLVGAAVVLLPLVASVVLESDWSPVVLVDELLEAWLPVVAEVLLDSDWSPVVVLFSIVRLERPRRSMFGWNVEVEPVTEFSEFAVEPVTDEVEDDVEPESEGGFTVTLPVEGEIDGCAVVPPVTPGDVDAWLSGMQSIWTALADLSFALPVSLPASLPALGWFSELQRGFVEVVPVVWAMAGAMPMIAEAMRLRVNGVLFMLLSSYPIKQTCSFWDRKVPGALPRALIFRRGPTLLWSAGHAPL